MIAKPLTVPWRMAALQQLLTRLRTNSPAFANVEADLAKSKAGYYGERRIPYYLSYYPDKEVFVFHNLRMNHNDQVFEMDLLLLTLRYVLILETKNLIGEIHFDSQFGQLIRTFNGKKEAFPNPIDQARRQSFLIGDWLGDFLGYRVPVEHLVVISNPATLITTDQGKAHLFKNVIHANKLPAKFRELDEKLKHSYGDFSQLRKVRNRLLKEHIEFRGDMLKKYNLLASDLIPGVQCPHCGKIGMTRQHRRWECRYCAKADSSAHLIALRDYFNLIGNTITNSEARNFLQVDSDDVVNRMLRTAPLEKIGINKGRKYSNTTEFEKFVQNLLET